MGLNVAFRLNGGLGTYIVRANFVKRLYDIINRKDFLISIFCDESNQVNDALFKNQSFVYAYYKRSKFNADKYDLSIDLRFFCNVLRFNEEKVSKYSIELYDLVRDWVKYQNDPAHILYFKTIPLADYNIYQYMKITGKNILNVADVTNKMAIDGYCYQILINENVDSVLEKYGIFGKQYVTINRGVNPNSNATESPKLWPFEHYVSLVKKIKEKTDYLVVQLGEGSEEHSLVPGVDLNLINQTSLEELKVILKYSYMHIDGECGMVHLRRAMGIFPSIVMFGQTPMHVFAYDDNINLYSDVCNTPCASLFNAWKRKCMLYPKPKCMESITPDRVLTALLDNKSVNEKKPTTVLEQLHQENILIDQKWDELWLSKQTLFRYYIEICLIKDLNVLLYDGNSWTIKHLAEHPAYLYYTEKNPIPYNNYMSNLRKIGIDNEHSVEELDSLKEKLDKVGYDKKSVIFVDGNNCILDGSHRSTWLYAKYGEEYKVTIVKIYGKDILPKI